MPAPQVVDVDGEDGKRILLEQGARAAGQLPVRNVLGDDAAPARFGNW